MSKSSTGAFGVDTLRVRPLKIEEVESLLRTDLVYVPDSEFTGTVLEPAYRKWGRDRDLENKESPKASFRTIYGTETKQPIGKIWVADDEGVEMPLLRTCGSRVSSSLFFTGIDEAEATERLKRALRAEFGPGVVEVWNLRSGPVKDIRWDVWEVRRDLVSSGRTVKRGKPFPLNEWQEVERRLIARGVRDGHQHHFMGKEKMGWSLIFEPHQPDTPVETL